MTAILDGRDSAVGRACDAKFRDCSRSSGGTTRDQEGRYHYRRQTRKKTFSHSRSPFTSIGPSRKPLCRREHSGHARLLAMHSTSFAREVRDDAIPFRTFAPSSGSYAPNFASARSGLESGSEKDAWKPCGNEISPIRTLRSPLRVKPKLGRRLERAPMQNPCACWGLWVTRGLDPPRCRPRLLVRFRVWSEKGASEGCVGDDAVDISAANSCVGGADLLGAISDGDDVGDGA